MHQRPGPISMMLPGGLRSWQMDQAADDAGQRVTVGDRQLAVEHRLDVHHAIDRTQATRADHRAARLENHIGLRHRLRPIGGHSFRWRSAAAGTAPD